MAKLEPLLQGGTKAAAESSGNQARSKPQPTLHTPKIAPLENQPNSIRLSGVAGLGKRERNCLVFILPPPQQLQQVLAHKTAVKIPILVQMLGDEGSHPC